MKPPALILLLTLGWLMHGRAQSPNGSANEWVKWTSPDGTVVLGVRPYVQSLFRESAHQWTEVKLSPLARGTRRHEYAGPLYFRDAKPMWIENKFLVLEKPNALEVVDIEHSQQLLSQVFESVARNPTRPVWTAIQLRAVGRHQEYLDAGYQDDLLLIDPLALSRAALHAKADAEPMIHVRFCELDGIALAPARWSRGGRTILCAVWHAGILRLVTYDGETLKKLASKEASLKIDKQEATSITFPDSKIRPQIEELLSNLDAPQ